MRGQSPGFGAPQLLGMCLLGILAGCNTTDALTPTPQEDIPNVKGEQVQQQQQQAVATADTAQDQMASAASQPARNTADAGYPPQNTLEAQQAALERGDPNPSLTVPDGNTSLGANLYKTNPEAQPVNSLYAANSISKGSIRFLPIIGAPVQAVTPLSRELGNAARSNGLSIKASSDATSEHVLKGYLSAFNDGKKVNVVYVWDVLDNSGSRLHRIQGQASVDAKGNDAWTSVPPETMQEIGDKTIAEYMSWKQSQG